MIVQEKNELHIMTDTKTRIIDATGQLFRRSGYNGTSLKQVTETAEVPVGSVYHFFPGGKFELTIEVIQSTGLAFRIMVEQVMDSEPTLTGAINAVFTQAGQQLEMVDYEDICPIGSVAREVASTNDRLRLAIANVFADWVEAAHDRFRAAGLSSTDARHLAFLFISSLEGSFILARTLRSREPMEAAAKTLCALAKTCK